MWAQGGTAALLAWAMEGQRTAQAAMAGALRSLRAGEAGALAGLLGLAFTYGVLHAVGPGHGKLLIGGYGAATQVPLGRLAAIGLLASLGQATVAVVLVHGGIAVLDWGRADVVGLGEGALTTASTAAIGAIGLWLAWRGARGLARLLPRPVPALRPAPQGAATGHDPAACASCGHRHGPDPAEVARLTGWREGAALIGAIAIRPCTGALFLLVLTWRMDITAAGIAGAYVMGLGTALVTVAVAGLSVLARDGARMWAGRLGGLRPLGPMLELGVGLLVVLAAVQALRLGL
nr:hypothetical protein [Rhodobaculum claviforme]